MKCPKCGAKMEYSTGIFIEGYKPAVRAINFICKKHDGNPIQNLYAGYPSIRAVLKDMYKIISNYRSKNGLAASNASSTA